MEIVHRSDRTFTWGRGTGGLMACRSHAIRDDDGNVWILDPQDVDGLDAQLHELGIPAGVIVLVDRHVRDSTPIAERLGIPIHVPAGVTRASLPTDVRHYDTEIPGCPFVFVRLTAWGRWWIERALWWPEQRILAVAEAVGTVDYFLPRRDDILGVHPLLHMLPPDTLAGFAPELLLVGHGDPVVQPGESLANTIRHARRDSVPYAFRAPGLMRRWGHAGRQRRAGC